MTCLHDQYMAYMKSLPSFILHHGAFVDNKTRMTLYNMAIVAIAIKMV